MSNTNTDIPAASAVTRAAREEAERRWPYSAEFETERAFLCSAFVDGAQWQADRPSGDEYHTMEELYEYRMLYNAHAVRGWLAAGISVVKSHRHHDGEECFGGGWFIVTAQLPSGQVSNHYRNEFWNLFDCPEVEAAPEWDGHTPQIAAERLRAALNSDQPSAEPTEAEIRAAARAMDGYDSTVEGITQSWEDLSEDSQRNYLGAARAALVAAREVSGR